MSKINPWVVDANLLHIGSDIEDFKRSFLLETDKTRAFLRMPSEDGENKYIISASKGFGKTLLLKCKNFIIRQNQNDYMVLPHDFLLDKPGKTSPISRERLRAPRYSTLSFWTDIWTDAICISTINAIAPEKFTEIASKFFRDTCQLHIRMTASEMFHLLLSLNSKKYDSINEEIGASIVPVFRSIHRKIAIFIDNLDDYFFPELYESDSKNTGKDIWVLGQLGLVEAIRVLRDVNPHIKIFASIRAEALHLGYAITPNSQQIRGITVELSYSDEELKNIFLRNVARVPRVRASKKDKTDIISVFIGEHNRRVRHRFTGKEELFLDFVIRHTLRRPRDLMEIGAVLTNISPPYEAEKIKEAVFEGAKSAVRTFFQTMRPFSPVPKNEIFKHINKNVLEMEDLKRISRVYNLSIGIDDERCFTHPFCSLYRLGLLGRLHRGSISKNAIQKFQVPHYFLSEDAEHILPNSAAFVVHPAIDELIHEYNGEEYSRNFNRDNIIGQGLPWDEGGIVKFVIKGDIIKYSEVMANSEFVTEYPAYLRAWLKESCSEIEYFSLVAGDSILMIDASPLAVLRAAAAVSRKLTSFSFLPRSVRFGASASVINFLDGEPTGQATRTAARLEVLSTENAVLIDDSFYHGLRMIDERKYIKKLSFLDRPNIENNKHKFNIRKNEFDPSILTDLWEIRLLDSQFSTGVISD